MTAEKLFLETSLYDEFEINDLSYQEIFSSVFTESSIDIFCPKCGDKSIFIPFDNVPTEQSPGPTGIRKRKRTPKEWYDFTAYNSFIEKEFKCSRNQTHRIHFYFHVNDKRLIKIGQFPSVADLVNYEIKSFQKILGNEYYKEFNKAIGLFSHGVGVGSFVYLRRIIENFIIKPALDKAKGLPNWNNDEYEKGRVKEKIDLLKTFLPDFLVTNKEIYSILSKGIHDLTEEECMNIFPVLKSSLILILTEIKTEREKVEKRKELEQALKNIHQKHK